MADFVYLDWAATAPLCNEAACAMQPYLQPGMAGLAAGAGNANSLYEVGRVAFRALEQSREDIARSIGARPDEIIFTSGATEADNAALFGIVDACMMKAELEGDHDCVPQVIVSSIEHEAVLEAAAVLGRWGALVSYVEPDAQGHITPEALREVMTDHVLLVSIMAVNNEVGSVMDIPALAQVVHDAGALFHVDATQALGKMDIAVKKWGVDAMSLSSHKIAGPKSMGALYLKTRTPFTAQIVGGGQESGMRSGTQNVMGAVGFAAACKRAVANIDADAVHLRALRDECYKRFSEYDCITPTVKVEPGSTAFAPHIVNVFVRGVESETLILQLDRRGVCVSGGSACTSHDLEPSHVLRALGISRDNAQGALRLSFGHETTKADIDAFFSAFDEVVKKYVH
ncbi:MAG: cysteine desulfurase family protein [Eggerthellaceae bacterium]